MTGYQPQTILMSLNIYDIKVQCVFVFVHKKIKKTLLEFLNVFFLNYLMLTTHSQIDLIASTHIVAD